MSLNQKKCDFGVTKGTLLGHIMSKEGVTIDPERVDAIDRIPQLKNINGIQSFFRQINFLGRFVTNFIEITRPISWMLKKGEKISWSEEPSEAFKGIKQSIKKAPVLKSLDF